MLNNLIASVLPFFPKNLVWLFSKRYIAGESLKDALRVSTNLNSQDLLVTLDVLGEFETSLDKIEFYKTTYLNTIHETLKAGIKTTYSLKPTMFGLLIDKEVCYQHIRDIVELAASNNSFIRIDMEDSKCTDLEIELFKRLFGEFPQHVGLVLQAYLKRTMEDMMHLNRMNSSQTPVNIRLCKGIYIEPEEISYKKKLEINLHFIDDLEFMLANNFHVAIATHDEALVQAAYKLIDKYKVAKDRFEFQMLYGVTPELRKTILQKGYKMRVYVPFGNEWFNYSTRRLKENPRMVSDILKALVVRK